MNAHSLRIGWSLAFVASTVIAVTLAGCGSAEETPAAPIAGLAPAVPSEFSAPTWAAAPADDAVVATVNGAPISRSIVLEAQRAAPAGTPTAEVLERLIELELLAQEAVGRGVHRSEAAARAWREALVQRYVVDVFEAKNSPEALSLEQVKSVYYQPSIRKLYDHADAWRMVHVYFSCCDPKVDRCDDESVIGCFADAGRYIQTVYSEIKPAGASKEGDPKALIQLFQQYRADNAPRFYPIPFSVRVMPFYYDPDTPHEEQKGYNIIAEAVARTTIEGEHAVIQKPIQSQFGWHVIARLDHIPESRKGPDDPEVIADIRAKALPQMRQARLGQLLRSLGTEMQAQLHPELLELLDTAR